MYRRAFNVNRWAEAFLAASGDAAEAAFLCLKTLAVPVMPVSGVLFGRSAALKLEKILREYTVAAEEDTMDITIHFICLLTEKNCLRYIGLLLQKIEQKLDEQKGIFAVTVETASAENSQSCNLEKELAQMIKENSGAADVKVKTQVRPELLGGFLLRMGSFFIDASLKGQLEKLKKDLLGESYG
ncbi:MAG: F0F1 ATP synthase subunit delta [Treponema sp.]|nr:F0F1 ATP synthase subunit delta [Treponema sp.]